MNNRFAVINFSPNLNIRRRTIKLRQLKAMFTFTTLRLHLHTIEYRMPLRGEFRLEIFQFPYWLSNPKFRPPALSFGAQKKFRSESLTVRDKPANQYPNKSGPQIHKLFCYFWKHSIHNSFDSNPLSYQRVSKRVLWENICWACKYFCEQIKAKKLLSAVRIFHMLAASISINLLKKSTPKR